MQYDYLAVRDGDNENSTLIGRFCGDPSRIPDPFISSFNYLWFNFVTDGSVQNRGFKLNYTTQPSVCGGILSGSDHGIIRSPLSPDRYPHGETFSLPVLLSLSLSLHFCLSLLLSVHSLSNSNYISLSLTLSFFFYIFLHSYSFLFFFYFSSFLLLFFYFFSTQLTKVTLLAIEQSSSLFLIRK